MAVHRDHWRRQRMSNLASCEGVRPRRVSGGGWAALLAALLLLGPGAALAQTEEAPATEEQTEDEQAEEPVAPEGPNIGFTEEVTVTSRKLGEESAQEVPTSVAAPSEEQLRN